MPASKGGKWEWENLVTACTKCNGVKGNKQLSQLRWKLRAEPRVGLPAALLPCGCTLRLHEVRGRQTWNQQGCHSFCAATGAFAL